MVEVHGELLNLLLRMREGLVASLWCSRVAPSSFLLRPYQEKSNRSHPLMAAKAAKLQLQLPPSLTIKGQGTCAQRFSQLPKQRAQEPPTLAATLAASTTSVTPHATLSPTPS